MHRRLIQLELATSVALLAVAAAWSAWRRLTIGPALWPTADAAALGAACGVVYAAVLPLVTASWAPRVRLLRGLRRAWNGLELSFGGDALGLPTILLLALCSAASEEVFFRGVVQTEVGVAAASVLFGLLHPFGVAYVLWATLAGLGLGGLFALTGTLAAPAAAHATYNLLALAYLRHRASRQEGYA